MVIVLFSLLLLILSIYIHKGSVFPISLAISSMTFVLVGLVILESDNTLTYFFGIFFFLVGYWIAIRWLFILRCKPICRTTSTDTKFTRKTLSAWLIMITVFSFVAYHYIVGGVPLFSSDVEVSRFNFTSSGLLGIPGRMTMMGLPMLLVYLSIIKSRQATHKSIHCAYVFTWIVFITSRVLAGFKGALLEVLVTLTFIYAINNQPLTIKIKKVVKYLSMVIIALVFASIISTRYTTSTSGDYIEIAGYILNRMTAIAAQPAEYVMDAVEKNTKFIPYIGYYYSQDFLYTIRKYFGIELDNNVFTLEKIVSTSLYGVPLSDDAFIVPVTVGAFAETIANIGMISTYCIMFLCGIIYAHLIKGATTYNSVYKATIYGYGVFIFHSYLTKGGLIFFLTNGLGIIFIFFTLVKMFDQVTVIFKKY